MECVHLSEPLTPRDAYTIFSLTSIEKQRLKTVNIQKTSFLGFLFYLFFFSDKTDSVEFFISVSKSNSPRSCPAYRKPVAHWGN